MSNKIAWVTDSASSLSKEFCEENHIYVVPMNLILGETSYRDGVDLSKEEFYEKLKDNQEIAKTSQPAYGEFIELYEMLKEKYDRVIAVHASSKLTGTYQSSLSAKEMTGFTEVEVIDSHIGDYCLNYMIEKGVALQKAGKSFEEIVAAIRKLTKQTTMYLMPMSLEQLKKSGRVSTMQNLLASVLNIKLILTFDDEGRIIVDEKMRSDKKMKSYIFGKINQAYQEGVRTICFSHAMNLELVNQWQSELREMYADLRLLTQIFVPIAGVHTGYGTVTLSWVNEQA
ncbi:MAG: DegV family protein [Bacillus sp. (in: firmicutes)]